MSKRSRMGCFLAGGFVIFLMMALGGWLLYRAIPSVEDMVRAEPIIVDLLFPESGAEILAGDPVNIGAKAFSLEKPLASFELWIDGQLFAQESTAGNSATSDWVWQSHHPGIHSLVVRAVDAQGGIGQSQVVIVNVLEGVGLLEVRAQAGQTLDEIGEQFDVPFAQMTDSNPGLEPAAPLPEGAPVNVPVPDGGAFSGSGQNNGQPPNSPTQKPEKSVNPLVFWINENVISNPPSPPQTPEVALTSDGCKFQIYITPMSENDSGYIVYRWKTGDLGFHKIAVLGPGQAGSTILFEDTIQPVDMLSYMYYVSAFNTSGEAPSSIVSQFGTLYNCKQASPGDIIQVSWHLSTDEPVDRFYCYETRGDSQWRRMPAEPFVFFDGQNGKYQQVIPGGGGEDIQIQVQCWGWLGGSLKYLGDGETKVSLNQAPNEVLINGKAFQLVGQPQFKPKPIPLMGGGQLTVPIPYALREASTAAECASHYGNPLAGLVCNGLINVQVKEYFTLVWEWQPKTCWPGTNCVWVNDIDGFYIYEIDPLTQTRKYLKDVNKPGQKVTAIPLPWGYRCYGVEAYAEGPEYGGQIVSGMATYCPGEPPKPEKTVLTPSNWLTTGGQWYETGDCDTYGNLESYLFYQNNGILNVGAGQVLVGSYLVDDDDQDCSRKGDYSGAVKFQIPALQPGAVFQRASLKYSSIFNDYKASGLAANYKLFCADSVGKAKQDWTGLGNNHFLGSNVLYSYNLPIASLSSWSSSAEVDVTLPVGNWLKHPDQNHGFIFTPAKAPHPLVDGSGTCMSGLGNFQLEIYYFLP